MKYQINTTYIQGKIELPILVKIKGLPSRLSIYKICCLAIFILGFAFGSSESLRAQTTVVRPIALSTDDCEEEGPGTVGTLGNMNHGSSDIELTEDNESPSTGSQKIGLRFTSLNIPQGATITNAYLTFRAISADSPMTNSQTTNLTIQGHKSTNAPTFSNTNFDITNRTGAAGTTAIASWSNVPSWTTGTDYNSPSLNTVIQELVNQSGWTTSSPIALIVTGSGHRATGNFGNGTPAKLTITYTTVPPITINSTITHESCAGANNGAINLTISGGTPPYNFTWNDGPTSEDRTGLSPGGYKVAVSDAASGLGTASFIVNAEAGFTLNTSVTQESTQGAGDGAINLTVIGATPPVSYQWKKNGTNYATTEDISGLGEGTYTVTVTDGCPSTSSISRSITPFENKHLYLSDPSQALDRVHPGLASPVDNTTAQSVLSGQLYCGAKGTFSSPTQITNQLGGQDALTPDLGVYISSSGVKTLHSVFLGKGNSDSKKNIYYSSKTGTGAWTTPVRISDDGFNQDAKEFPSVKVDANNKAHVVYAHKSGSDNKINIYYVTNASGSWSTPVRISNDSYNQDALTPEIALNGIGKAYVVYRHKSSSDNKTNIYYVTNASGSWSSSVRISNDGFNQDAGLNPSIAIDASNKAYVAYVHKSGSDAKKNIYYVTNTSGSWSSAARISNDGFNQDVTDNPSIAIDSNGKPHVVYGHKGSSDAKKNIYYVNKTGVSWSSPINLSNDINGEDSANPDLGFCSNTTVRVAFSNNDNNIFYTENSGSGGSWTNLVDINGSPTASSKGSFPSIAVSENAVDVVFQDVPSSGGKIDIWHTSTALGTINNVLTTTFTQIPTLCSSLTIKAATITVTNYVSINSGTMPANPNITAVLKYGATNIITLTNPTYSGGLLTWTGTLDSDVTVPSGQAIALEVTTEQSGVTFKIDYDSQSKPSKIELPVTTYININSYAAYDAPYPGGNIITTSTPGSTVYLRAVVTDPFGATDITGLDINISGSPVAATQVATAGCTKTYEYVWNTTGASGTESIPATAKEGFEGTVTDVFPLNLAFCTPVIGTPIFDFGATSTRCQGAGRGDWF